MGIKKTVQTSSGITTVTITGVAFVDGNRITGITSVVDANDVANKSYVDVEIPVIDATGQEGKFYTTTDGVSTSWDYVSNTEEFTTPGAQTFTLPNQANLLYIEAVGAGVGGGAGQTKEMALTSWTLRTISFSSGSGGISGIVYGDNLYVLSHSYPVRISTSTDSIIWTARTFISINQPINYKLEYAGNFYFSSLYSILSPSGGYLQVSTNAIVWTLRTSGFGTASIFALTYVNNLYIAAGGGGTLTTSTDTIAWTYRTSGFLGFLEINDIIYTNNLYIAGGAGATLTTSTDTIVWTYRTSGFGTTGIRSLTYGNGLYVAAGTGILASSTDTIVWTYRTTTSLVPVTIKYNNGVYVLGAFGTLSTSTDTIVWITRTSNITAGNNIESIAFNDNLVLISSSSWQVSGSYIERSGSGGSAGAYTSWYIPRNIVYSNLTVNPGAGGTGGTTDSELGSAGSDTTISWTGPNAQTYTITASSTAANIASSSSSFYTTAGTGGGTLQFLSSSSGNTAPSQTNKFQPTGGGSGAVNSGTGGSGGSISVYGNSITAVGGYDADIEKLTGQNATLISGLPYGGGGGGGGSSAGAVWTLRTSGFGTSRINDLTYGNNIYVAAGDSGTLRTSTDAIAWTYRTSGFGNIITSLSYGNNLYLFGSTGGGVGVSTDSIIWIARTSGHTNFATSFVNYLNNLYVFAAKGNGVLFTSTDTIVWTARTSATTQQILSATFGNSLYLIAGANGYISSSTNAIEWTLRTSGLFIYLNGYSSIFVNNNYIVTNGDRIVVSTDTINWIIRTSAFPVDTFINKFSLNYVNNLYVGVGDGGRVTTSTDAIVWTIRTSNTTNLLNGLTYGNNLYVAGGDGGTLTTSEPIPASGGNGVRGGGGGGGSVYSTSFGNGGNGGDGYVKITWW